MNIIRDDETLGIMMILLLNDWRIERCNIKGCTNKPNTIITGIQDVPKFGMCEEHYQETKGKGKMMLDLDFSPTGGGE